jgi:hypothetical protein
MHRYGKESIGYGVLRTTWQAIRLKAFIFICTFSSGSCRVVFPSKRYGAIVGCMNEYTSQEVAKL